MREPDARYTERPTITPNRHGERSSPFSDGGASRDQPIAETASDARSSPPEGGRSEIIHLVNDGPPQRLDHLLAEKLPQHSRAFLQRLIQDGYVTLPSLCRDTKAALRIPTGSPVRVTIPPPRKPDLSPQDLGIEILFEDENFAVVNKPAGLSVHPAPDQIGHTLVNALLYSLDKLSGIGGEERPGIVHRLDKETSGVLLAAKSDFGHRSLASQFKERTVHKTYIAITRGEPQRWEGRIDHALGRSYTHSKKQMIRTDGTGRSAVTDYRVLEAFVGYSLVELYPLTGRTHQIRVHLASLRMPCAADKLYGREHAVYLSDLRGRQREPGEQPILERHALHAQSISFRHPLTQEELVFSAPLPADMQALLKALERYKSRRVE